MTHRDARRGFARPRSRPGGCRPATSSGGAHSGPPSRCAPHVKRAHRAVFARFALSLKAAIRRRDDGSGVPA
jgi:hypothetical protein